MISVLPRWRHIRNIVSPIFSTSMLKHMMVLMQQSVATLVRKIEKDSAQDTVVDVHEYVKEFTMEVSVNASFSMDADIQVNKENPFMKNAKQAQMGANFVQVLASLPFLEYFSSLLSNLDGYDFVTSTARKIIKQRRQGIGGIHQDFLQLLLNTQKDEDKKLTESEIVAQSLIFLLTGFDSTSSAATFLIYILSLHPEIQEKIRKEVDDVWPNSQNELTYEILQKTPYLDMCYQESQRLYSAGHIATRVCTEDCEINGIQFKKGMIAVLPIYATHRLPEIWPEPDKFIPERFTPEAKANRSQYVFMPFSHGPRNCVGMRFATLNIKLIVVSLLKKFVIAKTEKTMDPIMFSSDLTLHLPKGSTSVKFLPRKGNNDAI